MALLYANENFSQRAVEILRMRGYDVLTSLQAGNANRRVQDGDVLDFAKQHGRAVLTFNRRDFIRLHNDGHEHAGIIVCTPDADDDRLATHIHEKIEEIPNLAGQLLRVYRGQ